MVNIPGLAADSLRDLRSRTSAKWSEYPDDVLPLWVAEMDYPLAPSIAKAMIDRITAHDVGYVGPIGALQDAFAQFARATWGWHFDPASLRTTTDVSVTVVESFRQLIQPGDGIVITPPVYPPFFDLVPEAGGVVVEVPLVGGRLDLVGLEAAFAAGARGMLLCNPHNPLGTVHTADELRNLAALASRYDVAIVSDEIHGPLAPNGFTPYLTVGDGIAVSSASKTWNIAGAKCAVMVPRGQDAVAALDRMPEEVAFRTSILGLHASVAAFTDAEQWRRDALVAIDANRTLLQQLLAQHLPAVGYVPGEATYLAWLDFRQLGWGDDPSARILELARVALTPGPPFGEQGRGFARLNLACSPEVLTEAVERIARIAG